MRIIINEILRRLLEEQQGRNQQGNQDRKEHQRADEESLEQSLQSWTFSNVLRGPPERINKVICI